MPTFGDLYLYMQYQLFSDRTISFGLRFTGEQYLGPNLNGLIIGTVDQDDLSDYPMADKSSNANDSVRLNKSEPGLDHRLVRDFCGDEVELLLRCCGYDGKMAFDSIDANSFPEHGAVSIGDLWTSPLCASVMYHKDVKEFAKDYCRIYLSSCDDQFNSPNTFGLSTDALLSAVDAAQMMSADAPRTELQMNHGKSTHAIKDDTNYCWPIDRSAARKICSIDTGVLRKGIEQVVSELPNVWMHRIGECGLMIGVRAQSSLGEFYRTLAKAIGAIV